MKLGAEHFSSASVVLFAAMLGASGLACPQPDALRAPAGQHGPSVTGDDTAFGFTAFPYDFTMEAIQETHRVVVENGTLFAIHLDNGVPWKEALADEPFPQKLMNEWNVSIPENKKVYVGLGVLATDRLSLAGAVQGSSVPSQLKGAALNAPAVKTAYLNYARRAVEAFQPDFLNLGIEAGEIAHRTPGKWSEFVDLYEHVRSRLKADYPDLQIGISFNLQTLMEPEAARLAKPLVESSDYLGLSFYPYASEFSEKYGAEPLPAPPGQWRDPLTWAAQYTSKPVALCETGYSTVDVSLPVYNVNMSGDADLQNRYVKDLGLIARDKGFLFVVWFLPIDYDALYDKMPAGDGSHKIWRNIGLLDGNLNAKPAFDSWRQVVNATGASATAKASSSRSNPRPNRPIPKASSRGGLDRTAKQTTPSAGASKIGFSKDSDLFAGPSYDSFSLEDSGPKPNTKSNRWSFSYEKGRWQWCSRQLSAGDLSGGNGLAFWVKSDRESPIFLQLVENTGEAFFVMVEPGADWSRVEFDWSRFEPDPAKRQDGRLDPSQVVQIMLADSAAVSESPKGERSIWLADLQVK